MNRVEHLLTIAAEEAAEVAQALSKCMRFGPNEIYKPIGKTNAERVIDEFMDLYAVLAMLQVEGVLDTPTGMDRHHYLDKQAKVHKWMDHSIGLGVLNCETHEGL